MKSWDPALSRPASSPPYADEEQLPADDRLFPPSRWRLRATLALWYTCVVYVSLDHWSNSQDPPPLCCMCFAPSPLARDLLLSPVRGGALTCFTPLTMGLLRPPSNHPKYQRSVEPRSICYFGKVKTETLLHLAQPVLLQCRWSAASSQTRQFCFDHLRPAQLVRRNELHPSKPLILSWWWRKASGHTLKDYGARNMFNNS